MKTLFDFLASPFLWLYSLYDSPAALAQAILCLAVATVFYLILQLGVASRIGKNYDQMKRDLFFESNRDLVIHNVNQANAKYKAELKKDSYCFLLKTARITVRIFACIVYIGAIFLIFYHPAMDVTGNRLATVIGCAISGLIGCGLSIWLFEMILNLCAYILDTLYFAKCDRQKTEEDYDEYQLRESFRRQP